MGSWWPVLLFLSLTLYYVHSQVPILSNGMAKCYVKCDYGYVFSRPSPVIYGSDEEFGECRKFLWLDDDANDMTSFDMPHAPNVGWALCVKGFPTATTRFFISLRGGVAEEKVIAHFDARLDDGDYPPAYDDSIVINDVSVNEMGGEIYGPEDIYNPVPYPFVVNQNFTLKFAAVEEFVMAFYVNDEFLANRTLLSSVTEIKKIYTVGDSDFWYLNNWCHF